MSVRFAFLGWVSVWLVATGCGGDEGTPDAGGPLTGESALTFTVTWGNAADAFADSDWGDALDAALFASTEAPYTDHRIVVLLCEGTDNVCRTPRITHEVTADEMTGGPIQAADGPRVTLEGLPPGRFRVMVIVDSGTSRANGMSWEDDFDTTEMAWGGIASELDLMLSGADGEPATRAVTLTDGDTADLGVLALDHVHERDLSPPAPTEPGTLVVAVDEGLRLIDTAELAPVRRDPYPLENAAGSPFAGEVCGLIQGPGKHVFVMFRDLSVGAGFAVEFDVETQSQLHAGRRVLFGPFGAPCRGQYHDGRLYVTNAETTLGTVDGIAGENFWIADPSGLDSNDVTATLINRTQHPALQHGIDDFVFDGDTMYATISGNPGAVDIAAECRTSYCVYRAAVGGDGVPVFDGTYLVGPEIDAQYTSALGTVTCLTESSPWTSLAIASFHDGRKLLFLGGCLEIAAFDLADDSPLDFSDEPGTQGLDGTAFGFAFTAFVPSPDRQTLWAIPQRPSAIPFVFPRGADGSEVVLSTRYMAMPIDLSQGDAPAVAAAYADRNIDGHDGTFEGSTLGYVTPATDPGLDLDLASYAAYQARLVPDASSIQDAALATGAGVIVRPGALWVRGTTSARGGASGLGKGADLTLIDLATRSTVLVANDDAPFYRFWRGGGDPASRFGVDIDPNGADPVETRAFLFVAD